MLALQEELVPSLSNYVPQHAKDWDMYFRGLNMLANAASTTQNPLEKTKLMPKTQTAGTHSAMVAAQHQMAQLDAIWHAMATHRKHAVVQTDSVFMITIMLLLLLPLQRVKCRQLQLPEHPPPLQLPRFLQGGWR